MALSSNPDLRLKLLLISNPAVAEDEE